MNKNILVLGNSYRKPFIDMGFKFVSDPSNAAIICFTGGTDVNPTLYGEGRISTTDSPDYRRDSFEASLFNYCVRFGIPMVGICRGFQFLNVMNGGRMIQHVYGHATGSMHNATTEDGETFEVNSYHHQMVVLPTDTPQSNVVVATPKLSKVYITFDGDVTLDREVESAMFPQSKSGGVQWHPEWLETNEPCVQYFHKLVRKLMT